MKTYKANSDRERHAVKLLHALNNLQLDRERTKESLEICLFRLGAIYRDFDKLSVDSHQLCAQAATAWETLSTEDKLSQLIFLGAMQGLEEEIDRKIVEQSLRSPSEQQKQIA